MYKRVKTKTMTFSSISQTNTRRTRSVHLFEIEIHTLIYIIYSSVQQNIIVSDTHCITLSSYSAGDRARGFIFKQTSYILYGILE